MLADRRLYLTTDQARVVEENDPDAATLFAAEGTLVTDADVKAYGIKEKAMAQGERDPNQEYQRLMAEKGSAELSKLPDEQSRRTFEDGIRAEATGEAAGRRARVAATPAPEAEVEADPPPAAATEADAKAMTPGENKAQSPRVTEKK